MDPFQTPNIPPTANPTPTRVTEEVLDLANNENYAGDGIKIISGRCGVESKIRVYGDVILRDFTLGAHSVIRADNSRSESDGSLVIERDVALWNDSIVEAGKSIIVRDQCQVHYQDFPRNSAAALGMSRPLLAAPQVLLELSPKQCREFRCSAIAQSPQSDALVRKNPFVPNSCFKSHTITEKFQVLYFMTVNADVLTMLSPEPELRRSGAVHDLECRELYAGVIDNFNIEARFIVAQLISRDVWLIGSKRDFSEPDGPAPSIDVMCCNAEHQPSNAAPLCSFNVRSVANGSNISVEGNVALRIQDSIGESVTITKGSRRSHLTVQIDCHVPESCYIDADEVTAKAGRYHR